MRLTILLVASLMALSPAGDAQEMASLKTDITAVQEQIHGAETENTKYTGGLVKSLIVARIAILRQTDAMLQQRSKASTFGISLKYTIDGSLFVPPASANDALRGVEQEIAYNQAKITRQEAETARYSGGLVQAMSLSTLATMRQTQAMLDQKRLALKYGLPQYVGFAKQTEPQANSPVAVPPESSPEGKNWEIVSVETRVTESNSVWSKYAWKLTLKNNSDRPQLFAGTIEFQDADGFIVDTSDARHVAVPARSEEVFTGYKLVRSEVAGKVSRTVAKIGKER